MKFKQVKIEDVADVTKLAGFEFTKYIKYNEIGEIIALRAINIRNNTLDLTDIKRIDKSVSESLIRSKLYKDDIILTYTGNGAGAAAIIDENDKYHLAPNICKITPKEINPYYLYKYITSNKFQKEISNNIGGSGQPTIPMKTIRVLPISVPSRCNQTKIAKILKNIDDKIKLNNEINNNLHDLCNNLYFRLVSQLNDTNSSVESIKNVAKCVLGGTPSRTKKEYWNGSINWINSGEINKFRIIKASEKITELGLNKSSTTLLPRGTTVLAITGATLGQVSRLEIDSCANQSVIGIITNKKELNNYMYLSILNSINDLVLKKTGGAQQHINKNDVETHEIIVPSTELISQFDEIIRPLFDQISVNCFEINKLEQLRDTLLPKLMNDEIDLDNIEI